jgi:hypothetical protein
VKRGEGEKRKRVKVVVSESHASPTFFALRDVGELWG